MMDSAFTLTPDTNKTDLITTAMIAIAITTTRMNTAGTNGTGTIIGTITIGIMTGTTTGIDALLILFSDDRLPRWRNRIKAGSAHKMLMLDPANAYWIDR
jgi:hypothetical protein